MTATRTVEESRQDALESQHQLNHRFPQKHCIDQLNDPLPLCEQLDCFAPLVDLSIEVNRIKEKQELEKKVANVEEQLEDAEAQLEAAQVAGVTTVQGKAYMYEDEGRKKWAVALDDAQGILEKANNELTAQVGQLEKKIQRQANEITRLLNQRQQAEAKVQTLAEVVDHIKIAHNAYLFADSLLAERQAPQ